MPGFPPRSTYLPVLIGLVLLSGLLLAYKHYTVWETSQKATIKALETSAKALRASADSTAHVADSLRAVARTAARRAVEMERAAPVLTPIEAIPVLCVKYVTEDRVAVEHWKGVAGEWKTAYEVESLAADSLERALAKERAATDSALKAVKVATKKSLLGKLLPRPCVSVVLGIDVTGKPNAVAGVGFCKEF